MTEPFVHEFAVMNRASGHDGAMDGRKLVHNAGSANAILSFLVFLCSLTGIFRHSRYLDGGFRALSPITVTAWILYFNREHVDDFCGQTLHL